MLKWMLAGCMALTLAAPARARPIDHLYLCNSPLNAETFWRHIRRMAADGVKITPTIAEQVCYAMRAGKYHQCILVQSSSFRPIASGPDSTLAMTDGRTNIWFHNPNGGGWVVADLYIIYLDSKYQNQ